MMRAWGSMNLRSIFRSRAVYLHGLTGLAALLTCLAVVLNVGPYANALKRNAIPSIAAQSGSISIARGQTWAGAQPDRVSSDVLRPVRPLLELSSSAGVPVAQVTSQPASAAHDDAETRAKPAREDRATPDPAAQPQAMIVGLWAPDASACSIRDFREGLLPTIINTDGAWAGETFCIFKNRKQTETGWRVVANCSNPHERWTADVRLTVKDNRLIWTSKRGTQVYTRCAPDFVVAVAR